MADAINADCHTTFRAAHTSGKRAVTDIKWIVMHDEEATSAFSAASWFANPKSAGSAHIAVDDGICYRTLADDDVAWGAPGANTDGFHIEQAGYANWSLVLWKRHVKTLQRAAYKAAYHCHKFGVPPVFVKAPGLKAGTKGITTHAEVTKAFGGTHTDPGPLWPRYLFMGLVRRYYKQLGSPGV